MAEAWRQIDRAPEAFMITMGHTLLATNAV